MGHRLLGLGVTLIMDYMDNRYKSCDYGRFFGFKITTSKKQKVLFDYANTTPVYIYIYIYVHIYIILYHVCVFICILYIHI